MIIEKTITKVINFSFDTENNETFLNNIENTVSDVTFALQMKDIHRMWPTLQDYYEDFYLEELYETDYYYRTNEEKIILEDEEIKKLVEKEFCEAANKALIKETGKDFETIKAELEK